MKILFMIPFINNVFFLEPIIKQLKKNMVGTDYDIVVINDAPKKKEKTQIKIISILSRRLDCHEEINEECKRLNVTHINIPENIHPWRNSSHGSNRHAEIVNWFLKNFETLYPNYKTIDFLCLHDADLFLVKPTNFNQVIKNYDIIAPMIKSKNLYYPQPSVMFINLRTVTNYKEMDFNMIPNADMGGRIHYFLKRNKNLKILEAGLFDGFWNDNFEKEGNFIKKIEFNGGENYLHYYDIWLDERFVHLRWGWGAGRGEPQHNRNLETYITKIKKVFELYDIELDFNKWINKNTTT